MTGRVDPLRAGKPAEIIRQLQTELALADREIKRLRKANSRLKAALKQTGPGLPEDVAALVDAVVGRHR